MGTNEVIAILIIALLIIALNIASYELYNHTPVLAKERFFVLFVEVKLKDNKGVWKGQLFLSIEGNKIPPLGNLTKRVGSLTYDGYSAESAFILNYKEVTKREFKQLGGKV